MSTYTWVTGSNSVAGPLTPGLFTPITLAIPANAILKRFQLRQASITAELDGIGVNSVGPGLMTQSVDFVDTHSAFRTIFSSARSIPADYTGLYDVLTSQRVYGVNYSAGDNELEINQGCSYGKHTDPFPKSVTFVPGVLWGRSGGLGPPTGLAEYTFAALYLQL